MTPEKILETPDTASTSNADIVTTTPYATSSVSTILNQVIIKESYVKTLVGNSMLSIKNLDALKQSLFEYEEDVDIK